MSKVDDISSALGDAAQGFATALNEATAVLSSIRVEEVDASAVTTGIDDAIAAASSTPVPVEADASAITAGIDDAVAAATPPPVQTEADTSTLASSIDDAVASATPAPIEVPVDAEEITSSIDAALSSVDTSGLQGELDSTAGSASRLAGASQEAGLGIASIAPAAALATGETGALSDIVGQVTPGMAGAAAATLGLVVAGEKLFDAALEQNTALARLAQTYGDLADRVEHVNFGGINEDLDKLAVRTGANVDGLRNFAASFGTLGKSAGDNLPHIADVSQQIQLLAVRASVLNPNLGTADEIVQRLSTSLARGGRFLSAYGLALSTAQINAEALRETGKQTTSDLSIYDKIVAGATLSTHQLGDALGTDINQGAQKAEVQLRSLRAAFEETLKGAGRPLVEPTIEAFRELEPVLASLAEILGTTLAGALHVVGPLLSGIAAVLRPVADVAKEIPTPVIEAATAFFLFLKLGPILAGALDSLTSFVTLGGIEWAGFGAEAQAAAAETQAAAAEIDAAAGEAAAGAAAITAEAAASTAATSAAAGEAAAGAGAVATAFAAAAVPVAIAAAGAALLGFAYARLTDDSARLNVGTGELKKGFADLHSDLDQVTDKFVDVQVHANAAAGELNAVGLTTAEIGTLALRGRNGYAEFLDKLVTTGQITRAAGDALRTTGESASEFNRQVGSGQSGLQKLNAGAADLIDTFTRVQSVTRDTARDILTAAVAHGQLSRAEEVTAISAHTARDGHVDWIGVLSQLRPQLESAGTATRVFGEKVDALNPLVQRAAAAQAALSIAVAGIGENFERNLVASGRFTQAQIDQANALNTDKNGTIDYGKALDALQPGLGAVATDQATLNVGLDTAQGRFRAAQDAAKLYKDEFDTLVQPLIDVERARQAFTDALDAMGNAFDINKDKADAFKTTVSEIVDPLVSVNEASLQLFSSLDKTNQVLATNKGAFDARTQAGRDDQQAILDLVKAYDSQIDAEIRAGDSTVTVNQTRADELAHLQALRGQYPGLTGLIGELTTALSAANTTSQTANDLLGTQKAELEKVVTDGQAWIDTLIKMGAPQSEVNQAFQDEINGLLGLKARYPELGPIIDAYVSKLGTIPPKVPTEIDVHSTGAAPNDINPSVQSLNSVSAAANDLQTRFRDINLTITADGSQALAVIEGVSVSITSLQHVADQNPVHIKIGGVDVPPGSGVTRTPGGGFSLNIGPGAMAGGTFDPWQSVLVGEAGPEVVTFPQQFQVHPHGEQPAAVGAPASLSIDYEQLAAALVRAGSSLRPIQVFEVAQSTEATAVAVSNRLGQEVNVG